MGEIKIRSFGKDLERATARRFQTSPDQISLSGQMFTTVRFMVIYLLKNQADVTRGQ